MATTPELLKARRKERRENSRQRALTALVRVAASVGLSDPFIGEDLPNDYTPSVRQSDTSALAALLRLGRRLRPLLEQATREVNRRWNDERLRRQSELKKAVRLVYAKVGAGHGEEALQFLKTHTYNERKRDWEEKT